MCRRPGGGSAHDPPGASRWRLGRFTSYLLVTQSKSDPRTSWKDSPTRKPDSKMKGDNKRLHTYTMCCNAHMCIFVQSRKRKVSDAKGIKSTSWRENLRGGPQHHPGVHLAALQLPPNQTHCSRNILLFSSNPDLQTSSLDSRLIGGLSCLDFRSHHFDCSLPTFLHLKTPSVLSLENTGSNLGSFQHWLSPKLSLSSCSAEDSFKNCRLDVGRPPSGDFLSASEDVPQCSTSSPIEPSYPCAARAHRLRRSRAFHILRFQICLQFYVKCSNLTEKQIEIHVTHTY